jgi:hypothetical protein
MMDMAAAQIVEGTDPGAKFIAASWIDCRADGPRSKINDVGVPQGNTLYLCGFFNVIANFPGRLGRITAQHLAETFFLYDLVEHPTNGCFVCGINPLSLAF